MVRCARYFLFYPQLWLKLSMPTKNEPIRTKIDDLVAKTKFGDRKSYASSSADTFLEIGENLSKIVRCAKFFYFIPNYDSSGACPQKMSHFGLKLTIWWPKLSSVIEKVKPHRARILFVNDNFSNNHCSKHTPYTCKGHSNSSPACVYCIFGIWNCLGNINTRCKISLY